MSLKFFTIVQEQTVSIVERFGKYHKTLSPGLHFLVPVMDQISYNFTLKEETIAVEKEQVITEDSVSVLIGGSLFFRIEDPYKASYKVSGPVEAVKGLALSALRNEIGKIKFDRLFQESQEISKQLSLTINQAANEWGITCLRYEILQIDPPQEMMKIIQSEAAAERMRRRNVETCDGSSQSEIKAAEAHKISQIKQAEGNAESAKIVSKSEASALEAIGKAFSDIKNQNSVHYILLQNYLNNYERTLRLSNVIVAPESKSSLQNDGNLANMNSNSGNSELVTIAAMLMLNGTKSGRQISSDIAQGVNNMEKISQSSSKDVRGGNNYNSMDSNNSGSREIDYSDLILKTKFYEDPILYSSDDETRKSKPQQKSQPQQQQNETPSQLSQKGVRIKL